VTFDLDNEQEVTMADKTTAVETSVDANQFAELQGKLAESEAAIVRLNEAVALKDSELKAASERISALERDARIKRFAELVINWSGDRVKHAAMLEYLAVTAGEDSEQFKTYIELQTAASEQSKAAGLFAEIGSDKAAEAKTPYERLEAEAVKIAAEQGITTAAAFAEACKRLPDVYNEYVTAKRRGVN
jgi:hypothetical protein